jgi:MFS family permease
MSTIARAIANDRGYARPVNNTADNGVGGAGGREASFQCRELQAIFGVTLMAVLGVSTIAPALPLIADSLELSVGEVSLLISAFTLPGVFLSAVAGVLADRHGRLRVLVPGLLLFASAGTACCFADDFGTLIVLRVLQGIGAAPIGTINVILISDFFTGHERTRAMGFNASVLSVGTAAYPALGGALALIAWYAPFALAFLALPVAVVVVRRLGQAPRGGGGDLGGYFAGVWRVIRRLDVLVLFFSCTSIFVLLYGAYVSFVPFLMAERFGSGPFEIGILMAGVSLATAITAANLGNLSKRFGEPRVLHLGFVVYAVALAAIPLTPSVWALVIPAGLLGGSFAATIPVVQVMLAEISPADHRGAVLSFNGTVLRLGQTIGPPLAALVYRAAGIDAIFYWGAVFAIFLAGLTAVTIRD